MPKKGKKSKPKDPTLSALFAAVCSGDMEGARRLLGDGDVNMTCFRTLASGHKAGLYDDAPPSKFAGGTCLHVAAWKGRMQVVQWLLDSGARNDIADAYDRQPSDVASTSEVRSAILTDNASRSSVKHSSASQIKIIFRKHDINGDGLVSKTELSYILEAIGADCTKLDDVFQQMDRNHDGRISYDELVDWIFETAPVRLAEPVETADSKDVSMKVSVCTLAGGEIFSNFPLNPEDRLERIRLAAEGASSCRGGFLYRLTLNQEILDDHTLVKNSKLVHGSSIMAVKIVDPAVEEMMNHFRDAADFLRNAPSYEGDEELCPGSEAINRACTALDTLGTYGLWTGYCRKTSDCVAAGFGKAFPAIALFLEMLSDRNGSVRRLAAWSLGGVGSDATTALPELLALLAEEEDEGAYPEEEDEEEEEEEEDYDKGEPLFQVQQEVVTSLLQLVDQVPQDFLTVVAPLVCHPDRDVAAMVIQAIDSGIYETKRYVRRKAHTYIRTIYPLKSIAGSADVFLPELRKAKETHPDAEVRSAAEGAERAFMDPIHGSLPSKGHPGARLGRWIHTFEETVIEEE